MTTVAANEPIAAAPAPSANARGRGTAKAVFMFKKVLRRPAGATSTDAAGPMSGRRSTASVLMKYNLRKGVLKNLFFPQAAHKEHLAEAVEDIDGSIRAKIVWFIHSHTVQMILLGLLVLDVLLVIAELIISGMKTCHVKLNEHGHYCPWGHSVNVSGVEHLQHNASGYYAPLGCGMEIENELSHGLHTAETVLTWASRVILFIFALELITLFCCLCHKAFNIPYVVDCVVIFTSIILDFTLSDKNQGTQLIIVLRCWRFLRILHGFGLTVHDLEEEEHKEEEMEWKKDEEELLQLRGDMRVLKEEYLTLLSDFNLYHEKAGNKRIAPTSVALKPELLEAKMTESQGMPAPGATDRSNTVEREKSAPF